MLQQVLSNRRENIRLPTPNCGLDLECGNLIFVCETPNYALSFDEVPLNLFEKFLSYYSDLLLSGI